MCNAPEVLCNAPEVLCNAPEVLCNAPEVLCNAALTLPTLEQSQPDLDITPIPVAHLQDLAAEARVTNKVMIRKKIARTFIVRFV